MRLHTWVLSLAAVALVCAPALAQQQPGRGSLLENKSVQEILKINEETGKKGAEIENKQRTALAAALDKLTGEESRGEKGAEARRANREETYKMLVDEKVLSADQAKTYKQIRFQQTIYSQFGGIGGGGGRTPTPFFAHAEVASALKFTNEQKEDIKKMTEDYNKARQAAIQDAGRDFQKIREATTKLNEEYTTKFTKSLTDDQKKIWNEVHGEKRYQIQQGGRPGGTQPRPRTDTN